MPALDRPRRSTRNSTIDTTADEPPKNNDNVNDDANKNDDTNNSTNNKNININANANININANNDGSKEDANNDGLLYDSDSDSDNDNDIAATPWLKQKPKAAPPPENDKPIIPKRKREVAAPVAPAAVKGNNTKIDAKTPTPPKVDIKRKKKDDGTAAKTSTRTDKPPTSSLIANMAPVDKKKFQPALRDWKPNAVFQKVRPPKSSVSKASGGNKTPPLRNQQQQQQKQQQQQSQSQYSKKDPMQDLNRSNHSNDTLKEKLGNKICKELNGLIFTVLESKGKTNKNTNKKSLENQGALTSMDLLEEVSDVIMKDKSNTNTIDWHGSFFPTDNEERLDFGNLEQDRSVPMFPEDFSKQKQWPLTWWGIIPPPDELLRIHNGRSRSRGSKERSSRDRRSRDRDFAGDRDRGWRDERERGVPQQHQQQQQQKQQQQQQQQQQKQKQPQQQQQQQPFRGDGWGNSDYRGPPPPGPGGHYGPPPQRERGGWDDPRMNDDRWRGGGGGRGFGPGPGPSRGAYGPGPYPRR